MLEFRTVWLHGVTITPGVENLVLPELLTEDWFCGVLKDDGNSFGTAQLEVSEDRMLPTG